MTFADWLILVERSGAPVSGIDPSWLQRQFQSQQQPALVANAILSGQAPRMMTQAMPHGKPKRAGCGGPVFSITFGILGFVGIVGGIIFGIKYFADHNLGGVKQNVDSPATISDAPLVSAKVLRDKGLDPTITYPYWPLVYDMAMKADKDAIVGKITNYGDKAVSNVTVQFGLFTAAHDKVGTAQDQIASLGPGETWSYQASVKGIEYEDCRLDSVTFK